MKLLANILFSALLSQIVSASLFRGSYQEVQRRKLVGTVTTLEVVNTVSNEKIFDLTDGAVIDLASLNADESQLSIQAVVDGSVSSVRFGLNGVENFRTEGTTPYTLCGDNDGNHFPCADLQVGIFMVSATPIGIVDGVQEVGEKVSALFEIIATNTRPTCTTKWTPFIVVDHSVEDDIGQEHCDTTNALVSGIHCVDHYCDDIRLQCTTCNECVYQEINSYWTAPFSEEHGPVICSENHFMTGLSCEGHYCDNLEMQCTENSGRTAGTDCFWSESMSEEISGASAFRDMGFVRGIECSGHYCDNKRFWICPVIESCD